VAIAPQVPWSGGYSRRRNGGIIVARANVLIVKGSPRDNGNSATLADQVAAGAEAAGAQVETVYLHGRDIKPCDACDLCQDAAGTGCVIDDDMQALYPKVRAADALVYASPVYWFTVSAQMKLFMDRCYALGGEGDYASEHALAGKRIGIVLTYGGDDPFDSGAINAIRTFQDMFDYVPAEIVDIVYGYASDAGEVKSNHALMEKALRLGEKLASKGKMASRPPRL
jgi:multimeric flavodoxin WrbA